MKGIKNMKTILVIEHSDDIDADTFVEQVTQCLFEGPNGFGLEDVCTDLYHVVTTDCEVSPLGIEDESDKMWVDVVIKELEQFKKGQ